MSTRKPADDTAAIQDLKSNMLLCTVYLHRLLRNQARRSTENWAELSVLNNLAHWGEQLDDDQQKGISQKALARLEQVSQAAMSNIVRKLRTQKFVQCRKSERDQRSVRVMLTAKGQRHLDTQGPRLKEVFDQCLSTLSNSDLAKVTEGQQILARALQESTEVQASLQSDSAS